ncbi:MAG: S-layer homology domain-containing protein, partial [Clostridia bacterium]|nr:S-layer homology domain-containing protein [Clostridia bacterium]
ANVTVALGGKVSFTVKAEGTGLTYQWQLSDDNGKTWRNSSVKKADYNTTLSKSNVNRQVRCIVTDKNGNKVTSNAASMKKK